MPQCSAIAVQGCILLLIFVEKSLGQGRMSLVGISQDAEQSEAKRGIRCDQLFPYHDDRDHVHGFALRWPR